MKWYFVIYLDNRFLFISLLVSKWNSFAFCLPTCSKFKDYLLTCCNDVKNARNTLWSYFIWCITKKRSVIEFRYWSIGDDTGSAQSRDMRLCYVRTVGGIVECPPEMNVGRISVHLTLNLGPFLFRYTIDFRLVGFARRWIWKWNVLYYKRV